MFQLCRACQRHIKSDTCPFCGGTESSPVARTPADAGRISRGQLLVAVAVAGALGVAACGDEPTYTPFYGAPGDDGASSSSGASTSGAPIYGSSPPPDAGEDASSSGAVPDASTEDAGETSDAEVVDASHAPDAE